MATKDDGVIYAIEPFELDPRTGQRSGGHLVWYHHDGWADGSIAWQGPKTVGKSWNVFKQVFSGGDGIIYGVQDNGDLMWYRHDGQGDGTFAWQGPKKVGTGWNFQEVFSGGNGVIYAIQPFELDPRTGQRSGGHLVWYHHDGWADGTFAWQGPKIVGNGWNTAGQVFSGGNGVIYAIQPFELDPRTGQRSGGHLVWYHHDGWADGTFAWQGPKTVGNSWHVFKQVFSGGDGIIYGVQDNGDLMWYRHDGQGDGTFAWQGPKKVGTGWNFQEVFAARIGPRANVASGERFCDFLDPAGSPGVRINSYGLIDGHPRKSQLTFSISANVPNVPNTAQIVQNAFNIWAAATAPVPGATPLLSGTLAAPGQVGDITVTPGPVPLPRLGNTIGQSITISTNFIWKAQNPTPPGTFSLLSTVTHELGHALGLLHSTNPASMMTPLSFGSESLGADDIAAIRALYGWAPQRPVPGIGTETGPALCACGSSLVMAWRGVGDDDRVWVSRSTDGITWSPQHPVPGAGTTDAPTLAWDGTTVWMAIRGVPDDDSLYWATSGDLGDNWSGVTPIPGVGSLVGPAMTIFSGVPLLVWRGILGDDGLWFSTWSNASNAWAGQKPVVETGSADRPSVCVDFSGVPRMVWRGIPDDDKLYTSTLIGIFWQPQQVVEWVIAGNGPAGTVGIGVPGSDFGPSVTSDGTRVFLAWRGVPGDDGIYFTQAAAGPGGQPAVEWSTQAEISGTGTSHRPAIAVFNGRIVVAWKGIVGDTSIYTTIN